MKNLLTLLLILCAGYCHAQTVKVGQTPVYSTASSDTAIARAVRPLQLQLGVLQNTINQQQIAITAANTTIAQLQATQPKQTYLDPTDFNLIVAPVVDTVRLKTSIIVK